MHYLKCIAMLDYLLKKLYSEQRKQVPVSTLDEVLQVVDNVIKALPNEQDVMLQVRLQDVQTAAVTIKSTQGILFLTDAMKDAIVGGINEVRAALQILAFNYFVTNDFEPTPEIIPMMRDVVKTAAERGLIQKGA